MNETIKTIHNHRSIRSYTSEKISKEHIDAILKSARCAANSINGQSYSIIEVCDEDKKAEIVDIASKQRWILPASNFYIFCIDYSRAMYASEKCEIENLMVGQTEAIMLGATDIGIAIGQATVAAESLGYGVVPIGAIRNDPQRIIDILELPKYTFPLVGFVIGVIDDYSAIKPRVPDEGVIFTDRYIKNHQLVIDKYDDIMSEYMNKRTGGKSNRNWSQTTVTAFSQIKHPDVTTCLKRQGFELK